jgi:hypothetical protein
LSGSQEPLPSMGLEQVGALDVAAERVDRSVSRHFRHLQHVGAGFGGGGQEPGPQGVRREVCRIELAGRGTPLQRADEGIVAERSWANPAALQHRAEHRPFGDRRGGEPGLQRLHGPEVGAARDGDLLAFARLVGLGAADQHAQPAGALGQVGDLQGEQFGAAERAGEAEREQGRRPRPASASAAISAMMPRAAASSRLSANDPLFAGTEDSL